MRNWDKHYADPANLDFTPAPLVTEAAGWLAPGYALDLACGAGRNALYLAALGWRVTAVDNSVAALERLRQRAAGLEIDVRRADLEAGEFTIPPDAYDLICDFFYLQRDLFPAIRAGTRPGGVFAGAMHLARDAGSARPGNPAHRLQPGELRHEFEDWKILYYSESADPGHGRASARILARRA